MNDDDMDEMLVQGARDYNEPGSVPREEMWARIRQERGKRAAETEKQRPTRRPAWVWVSGAAAAALILSAGIVIGRRLEHQPAPVVAVNPPVVAPKQDSVPVANNDTIVPQLREETRNTDRRVQALAAANPPADNDAQPNLAYRLVMLRHIAGSEAMITAFRASARRGEVDSQMVAWSRDLLTTTRMLEASPVAKDPTLKRLLEDLDLVIVQIAQYVTRGMVNTEELDLIEQSINKRGVIMQLRSSLPVRATPAGT